jgi:uncharacterized glyoxalase superfamily protein PhnB
VSVPVLVVQGERDRFGVPAPAGLREVAVLGDQHGRRRVDAAYAEARRRGYEIVHPLTQEPWGTRRFFVRDPNGIVVNVVGHPD